MKRFYQMLSVAFCAVSMLEAFEFARRLVLEVLAHHPILPDAANEVEPQMPVGIGPATPSVFIGSARDILLLPFGRIGGLTRIVVFG